MDRRDLLKAMTFVVGASTCSIGRAQGGNGCCLTGGASSNFASTTNLLSSCGVPIIDSLMPAEISLLSSAFLMSPDFSFFDDTGSPNAYATSNNIVGSSPVGCVIFGTSLLQSELGQPWWGAAVAGIAAHEWAHIGQFASGLSAPTWKQELHADFLAGWYLGRKALAGVAVAISGLGNSLFNKGSYDFFNPAWHGTPAQRVQAMLHGYNAAPLLPHVAMAYNQGKAYLGIP